MDISLIINFSVGNYKSREDFTITSDLEKEISPESPVHHRAKAIKDLCDAVLNQQWEDVSSLFQMKFVSIKQHILEIIECSKLFFVLIVLESS